MRVGLIRGARPTVQASGEIDCSNVEEMHVALEAAAKDSPSGFVVDLTQAIYIDSAGIAALVTAYRRVSKTGGGLALVVPEGNVRRLLSLIRLEVLPGLFICDDPGSAERALPGSAERTLPA